MTVGERIRFLRMERGLTQKQLGDSCGLADSAIRRYESNRGNPTQKTLQRIANALEIPVGELMGLSDVDAFWAEFDESVQINRYLDELNDDGKKEAVKRVGELTEIPKYKKAKK